MRTNIPLDLDDDTRRLLANAIDGRDTQRLATRREITAWTLAAWEHIAQRLAIPPPELGLDLASTEDVCVAALWTTEPQPTVPPEFNADQVRSYLRGWHQLDGR